MSDHPSIHRSARMTLHGAWAAVAAAIAFIVLLIAWPWLPL